MSRWIRSACLAGCLSAVVAVLPLSQAQAQPDSQTERGAQALRQGRCEVAADALNEGLKEGDPTAYYVTGLMYLKGYCVKADPARSAQYLGPAAKAAQADAARTLVMMHGFGVGVPQSYAQAGVWFHAWRDILALRRGQLAGAASAPAVEGQPNGTIAAEEATTWGVIGAVAAAVQDRIMYPRHATGRSADEVSLDLLIRIDPSGLRVSPENVRAGSPDLRGDVRYSAQAQEDTVREAIDAVLKELPPYPLPQRSAAIKVPYRFKVDYRLAR